VTRVLSSELRGRRILLFGSEGFIGGHILERFAVRYHVVAPRQAEVDLLDRESLARTVSPGDVVVNAAGYADATDRSDRGKALFRQVNVEGLRNLAAACEEAEVGHLVHVSSVAAMGPVSGDAIDESVMHTPATPYASSKLEGEKVLAGYSSRLPVTIVRPTSVFGEGRGLAKTLCGLIDRGVVPLPSDGRAKIPFTYVGNVVDGIERCLGNERCFGRTYIVGDEDSYRLKDIILQLASAMGRRPVIVPVVLPVARAAARLMQGVARLRGTSAVIDRQRLETLSVSVTYSIKAFQRDTGYVPGVSMPEAAAKIAEWYIGLKSMRTSR
jgi:nucleoside-diphosphate-sugar epimerase